MLTVLEALNLSSDFLERKGIESPRLNAELLLADILGCRRLDIYLSYDRPLSEDETNKYRENINRRAKFEPMQYIVGYEEFYGMRFLVTPAVLIPRPETEILVEKAIEIINNNEFSVLDIGTGSGIIPISIAKHCPNAKIFAVDISEDAVKIAQANAMAQDVEGRVLIGKMDILSQNLKQKYNIIISNPPYVQEKEFDSLQNEIKDYEPKIAVTDFEDGFKFYKRIINIAKESLDDNGKLMFEVGLGQAKNVKEIMEKEGFSSVIVLKDFADIDRIVIGELK